MGAPREYFLDILECSKTAEIQPTEEDVLEMIARGVTKGAPTVGAVKLNGELCSADRRFHPQW